VTPFNLLSPEQVKAKSCHQLKSSENLVSHLPSHNMANAVTSSEPQSLSSSAIQDSIRNQPWNAASTLRELSAKGPDSDLLSFLYQLVEVLSPENSSKLPTTSWKSLVESGMPQLVVKVLLREMKGTKNVRNSSLSASVLLLTIRILWPSFLHVKCFLALW
jgi:hypothetical protein